MALPQRPFCAAPGQRGLSRIQRSLKAPRIAITYRLCSIRLSRDDHLQARIGNRRVLARGGRKIRRALPVARRVYARWRAQVCGPCCASLVGRAQSGVQQACSCLASNSPVFYNGPEPEPDREFQWLAPDIVAEASFLEWTPNGEVRHPLFSCDTRGQACTCGDRRERG
ncbi:ATP dependent DNA ligase [Caballeronia calidae]|uniref:ATP dependent DNA ligase n=1 Tax=Caballeronia calidae TaxID=1777139 RepID=UPI002FC6D1BA